MEAFVKMLPVYSNLTADFLFPKLHGRWARAFVGERLQTLVRSNSLQGLGRALSALGVDIQDRAEVQKKLTLHLIDDLAKVSRLLDPATGTFYQRFIYRFYLENLKTILHYRYFRHQASDIRHLLIDSSHLPDLDRERLDEARNVHQFYRLLPADQFKEDLLVILVELDDTHDLFVAESRIDVLYYRWLLKAARALRGSGRRVAVGLVQGEIDVTNLVILLRNVALYHLPFETVRQLLIPGGTPLSPRADLGTLDVDRQDTLVKALPQPYRKQLQPLLDRELYVSENALWTALYGRALDHFRDYGSPPCCVPAYPFLKRFEAMNVGRLFEGLYLKLPAGTIGSMMIGERYV